MSRKGNKQVKEQVVDKLSAFITAGFALAAALAWNEAIQQTIKNIGLEKYGPFFYAVIITILAVIMAVWIGRIAGKLKQYG